MAQALWSPESRSPVAFNAGRWTTERSKNTPALSRPVTSARYHTGPMIGPNSGNSVVPEVPNVNMSMMPSHGPALLSSHGANTWKPEEALVPPATEPMGPPNLSSAQPAALPSMVRPERDMTPMTEATQAYDRQRGDMSALGNKERGVYSDLAGQYTPQGTSFGGLMSNLRSLEAVEALASRTGKSYDAEQGRVGALPYLSTMDKAGDSSRETQREFDKGKMTSMFAERNPLTQAQIENFNSQAELHKAQGTVAKHAALPENLTSKADTQQAAIAAHARELGAKAYSDFLLKNPENQQGAMDAGMIASALAQGKEVDPGSAEVPAIKSNWVGYGGSPAIPAVRPKVKGERIIQDAAGNKMVERNGRWEKL